IVMICLIRGTMVGSFRIASAKFVGGAISRMVTSWGCRWTVSIMKSTASCFAGSVWVATRRAAEPTDWDSAGGLRKHPHNQSVHQTTVLRKGTTYNRGGADTVIRHTPSPYVQYQDVQLP